MSSLGPFADPIPPKALKDVAAVVPRLNMRDIRLVRISAALKAVPQPQSQTVVDLKHDVKTERANDGNVFVARVQFKLKVSTAEESGEFMGIDSVFQLWYEVDEPETVNDDELAAFAEINAVHTAWPYLRELVHSVTGRMGLQPMTVPLLKIRREEPPEPDGQP